MLEICLNLLAKKEKVLCVPLDYRYSIANFEKEMIRYGEKYSFLIRSYGCDRNCTAQSNTLEQKTSIYFLFINRKFFC